MTAVASAQPANIEMNDDDEGFTPGPFDVLCGRDRASFNHEGNRKFRAVVQVCLPRYRATKNRSEKAQIADYIEAGVHEKGGRFLKQDSNGVFRELNRVGRREKITHALRDAIKKEQDTRSKRENRIHLLHQACQWQVEKDADEDPADRPNKDRIKAIHDACQQAMKEEQNERGRKEDAPEDDSASHCNSEEGEPGELNKESTEEVNKRAMAAALAHRNAFAQQQAAFAGRLHHPFGGPLGMMHGHGPPVVSPMGGAADGPGMPQGLALLEQASSKIDGPSKDGMMDVNHPAAAMRKSENAYLAFKGLQAQANMSGMNAHQQAAFWQEQARVMTMMLAMREQELGVMRQALWESASKSTSKEKEILKLKEELAIKDRTLRTSRRRNQEDPPEDDE